MLYIRDHTNTVVAAVQYTEDNIKQVVHHAGRYVYMINDPISERQMYVVDTPNGIEELMINDWVVKVGGFYYRSSAETFDKHYRVFFN